MLCSSTTLYACFRRKASTMYVMRACTRAHTHTDRFIYQVRFQVITTPNRTVNFLNLIYSMFVVSRSQFSVFVLKWWRVTLYRTGQALGFPGGWSSQNFETVGRRRWQRCQTTHRPPLPSPPLPKQKSLVLISVRGWVDPRTIVWPEGLCECNTRMNISGIEPATFRLVA